MSNDHNDIVCPYVAEIATLGAKMETIEHKMVEGIEEIKVRLITQNGRVGKAEDRISDLEKDNARKEGAEDQKQKEKKYSNRRMVWTLAAINLLTFIIFKILEYIK